MESKHSPLSLHKLNKISQNGQKNHTEVDIWYFLEVIFYEHLVFIDIERILIKY